VISGNGGSGIHIQRVPLTYDHGYWAVVFPLGMYTVCTQNLIREFRLPFLEPIPAVFVWVALAAWGLTAPAPDPLHLAHRPGFDRLAVQETPQVLGQLQRCAIAPVSCLGHRLQTNGFQVAGDLIVEAAGVPGLLVQHLVQNFFRFRTEHPEVPLQLVLAGKRLMEIPSHPDIVPLGYLEEKEKRQVLAAARLLIMPSSYESLSIVVLEAWSLGVPVLVNGQCAVLRGQCRRSGGGLEYSDYEEFRRALIRFVREPALGRQLGERGRRYVREHYAWPLVERSYLQWAERVCRQAG
jgi:hypothetical protein